MMATFFNHFEIVKYLVEHHADINIARKEVCSSTSCVLVLLELTNLLCCRMDGLQ